MLFRDEKVFSLLVYNSVSHIHDLELNIYHYIWFEDSVTWYDSKASTHINITHRFASTIRSYSIRVHKFIRISQIALPKLFPKIRKSRISSLLLHSTVLHILTTKYTWFVTRRNRTLITHERTQFPHLIYCIYISNILFPNSIQTFIIILKEDFYFNITRYYRGFWVILYFFSVYIRI